MNYEESILSKLSICVVVWGEEFVETFLNYSLLSILSEKNLPHLAKKVKISMSIYTDKKGFQTIKKSASFKILGELASINFFLVKGMKVLGPYRSMNDCHRHFISKNKKNSLMIICPDTLFSDSSLGYLYDIHSAENKPICIFTPRTDKQELLRIYQKNLRADAKLALNNSDLLNLALENLHTETKSMILNSELENSSVSGGFYLENLDGLIGSQFHYYPIIFKLAEGTELPDISIDSDFINKIITDYNNLIVINDVKECCIIDITDRNRVHELSSERRSVAQIVQWANVNTGEINRKLFDEIFYFSRTGSNVSVKMKQEMIKIRDLIKKDLIPVQEMYSIELNSTVPKRIFEIFKNNNLRSIIVKIVRKLYLLLFNGLIINVAERTK